MAVLKNALSLQSMLGGYMLVEELGRGSYGAVYRGTKDGKVYALKEQLYEEDGSLPHGFLREAAVVMCAQHPNIVRAYEVVFLENRLLLVLECATMTLTKWLRSEHSTAEKYSVAFQILSALAFLQRHNCIHGDLKPDNILLFKDGSVKIADFGLAVHNYGQPLSANVQSIWWRAPEVLRGSEYYNGAIDMWSYGVILYHMFTGRHLFTETEPNALLQCQRTQLVERLLLPGANSELTELLTGCLQCDPNLRFSASYALTFPVFRDWQVPVGSWPVPAPRQAAQHWYLERLQVDDITRNLIYQLVERCNNLKEATVIACSAIAVMLLRNTWPVVPGYLPGELRQVIQEVCQSLQCAFY
jgi:serine/threonine protein kinase